MTIEQYTCAIRYAGEYYDHETGLYYLRARYYNPYIGRFISEDSYWGEDTNPLSLNLYTYASNNPIKYIDPTGHMSEEERQIDIERKIAQIDRLKQMWVEEEQGAGKNQRGFTQLQAELHNKANTVRAELIEIENSRLSNSEYEEGGNKGLTAYKDKETKSLINLISGDNAGIKGSWEAYKLAKAVEIAEY